MSESVKHNIINQIAARLASPRRVDAPAEFTCECGEIAKIPRHVRRNWDLPVLYKCRWCKEAYPVLRGKRVESGRIIPEREISAFEHKLKCRAEAAYRAWRTHMQARDYTLQGHSKKTWIAEWIAERLFEGSLAEVQQVSSVTPGPSSPLAWNVDE